MRLLSLIASALLSAFAASSASANIVNLLDHYTHAVNTDGGYQAIVVRSYSGFSGGESINTVTHEAELTADDLQSPTSSGLVYDFSPHKSLCSRVTITAMNRQTSVTETGILAVNAVTTSGTFTLSQTLPGNTPTMQTHDFDFTALAGPIWTLQRLEVTWDLPAGGTGLRGLAIDKIELYDVPEPATIALIGLASSCGGLVGYRRRKLAAKKK
jgi:hypothetical protein